MPPDPVERKGGQMKFRHSVGLVLFAIAALAGCTTERTVHQKPPVKSSQAKWPYESPLFDHVVIVVMENRSYGELQKHLKIQPFLKQGLALQQFHASFHPSYPN